MTRPGNCRLCSPNNESGVLQDLHESHIIPKLVFRWMKKHSLGRLRFSGSPTRPQQDGAKEYWMCLSCERKFNRPETDFANKIFSPLLKNTASTPIQYDNFLHRVCVSVVWRVLLAGLDDAIKQGNHPQLVQLFLEKELTWRHYLTNKSGDATGVDVHLLHVGSIGLQPSDIGPEMNLYSLLGTGMEISVQNETFVYAKMGPFIIIGFIRRDFGFTWAGGAIDPSAGDFPSEKFIVPEYFKQFLQTKAVETHEFDGLTNDVRIEIEELLRINTQEFLSSERFATNMLAKFKAK